MSVTALSNTLITSRPFPQDVGQLTKELNKMYTEVSQSVNFKTNGMYELNQTNTSNNWFSTGNIQSKRQSFRQVFQFSTINPGASLSPAITHGIAGITQIVQLYGTCITAASVNPNGLYLPIPYVSTSNADKQIQLDMNATQINITNGSGADKILSGIIVVEYLLN